MLDVGSSTMSNVVMVDDEGIVNIVQLGLESAGLKVMLLVILFALRYMKGELQEEETGCKEYRMFFFNI